ncbi:MAG: hypothetical protein EAZ92_09495 [Candidatus Kapaibacterium sp.]|nr:MAG: hypothetical protein EAZ92_09495 [Candidatus Kapabacteria bacterium]
MSALPQNQVSCGFDINKYSALHNYHFAKAIIFKKNLKKISFYANLYLRDKIKFCISKHCTLFIINIPNFSVWLFGYA